MTYRVAGISHGAHRGTDLSPILARAATLASAAQRHPTATRRTVAELMVFLLVGTGGTAVCLGVLAGNAVLSSQARLLWAFGAIVSGFTMVAAIGATLMVLWRSYVYQYVVALEAKEEAAEACELSVASIIAMAQLADDHQFRANVVKLVLQACERTARVLLALEKNEADTVVMRISEDVAFESRLSELVEERLRSNPEAAVVLDTTGQERKRARGHADSAAVL